MFATRLLLLFLICTAVVQAQDEPVDGWSLQDTVWHSPKELKEIRKAKFAEVAKWEDDHFKTPAGKWYFGTRGGYTINYLTIQNKSPKEYLGTSDLYINDEGDIINKGFYSSNAGGMRAGMYAGYMFNNYVGLELDLGVNFYKKITMGKNNTPTYKSELITWSRDISVMPQIVFNTPNIRNFYFYAKVGFFVPVWGFTSAEAHVEDLSGKFVKDLAGTPTSGFITLVDLIAEALGESVDGLEFLEDGIFNALGYKLNLDADIKIDLRAEADAIGFTATLGGRYQISPVVSLFTEFRVAGYNISTKTTTIENLDLRAQLAGNPDFMVLDENGGTVNGNPVGAEDLAFLLVTNYEYELTEESNHATYNPNGLDTTKPSDELATRNSANGFTMSMGIQFNFKGRKNRGE